VKLGLFTPVFGHLNTREMIARVRALRHVRALELGTGGWPGSAHLNLDEITSAARAREFLTMLEDADLSISALSCHANPLHPNRAVAQDADALFQRTVVAAERLGVSVVVTFSGCPGDHDGARHPNWITTPWPPEFRDILDWQWHEHAIPYWRTAAKMAADHGVNVALEAHPGFLVYNADTALRLRAGVGQNVGVNLDPSHLYWQGVDIPAAIHALGAAIFHVHAKDLAFNRHNVDRNGVLDTKEYRRMGERSWLFRSVGWGHDETEWRRIVSALRLSGYDHVLSIEHEDALASIDEGLGSAVEFLARVVLREAPAEPWWT
jgi:sugar phosphate isomerase/epimerase